MGAQHQVWWPPALSEAQGRPSDLSWLLSDAGVGSRAHGIGSGSLFSQSLGTLINLYT